MQYRLVLLVSNRTQNLAFQRVRITQHGQRLVTVAGNEYMIEVLSFHAARPDLDVGGQATYGFHRAI